MFGIAQSGIWRNLAAISLTITCINHVDKKKRIREKPSLLNMENQIDYISFITVQKPPKEVNIHKIKTPQLFFFGKRNTIKYLLLDKPNLFPTWVWPVVFSSIFSCGKKLYIIKPFRLCIQNSWTLIQNLFAPHDKIKLIKSFRLFKIS